MADPHSDDAHRTLQRRALANVHALARRLGYRDSRERAVQRWFLVGFGLIALGGLVAIALIANRPDPRTIKEARDRCERELPRVAAEDLGRELRRQIPAMDEREISRRAAVRMEAMEALAARECAQRHP